MRKPKSPKVPGQLRKVVGANVGLLMKVIFVSEPNQPKALAVTAGVSKSTVQRVIEAQTGADLETLEKIADALGLIPYQLFIPNLDPKNPQVARGAMPGEHKAYQGSRIKSRT